MIDTPLMFVLWQFLMKLKINRSPTSQWKSARWWAKTSNIFWYHYTSRAQSSGHSVCPSDFQDVCLSVRLSVHIRVRSIVCFCLLVWHWLIIFGTWVYHHERLCRTLSWSWYDVHLWPQGLYSFFLHVFHNCSLFEIGVPYMAHVCITMRRCVSYYHDPNTTLTFDLKVFTGFLTFFCVRSITIFWFDMGLHRIWHMRLSLLKDEHWWSRFDLDLWPQGQICRFFHVFVSDP